MKANIKAVNEDGAKAIRALVNDNLKGVSWRDKFALRRFVKKRRLVSEDPVIAELVLNFGRSSHIVRNNYGKMRDRVKAGLLMSLEGYGAGEEDVVVLIGGVEV